MKAVGLEKPSVPVAYALLIFDVAAGHGVPRERILKGLGIPEAVFEQADARLSLIKISQLLYRSLQLTGNSALGYEIGLHSNLTSHGFLGYGLMSFPTARDAIGFGAQFLRLRLPNLAIQVFEEDNQAVVEVSETTEQGPVRQCVFDLFLVGIARIAAQIVNRSFTDQNLVQLWFDYPEPEYFERYRHRLPPVRFGMEANQLRFPASFLDLSLSTANPVTATLVKRQCEQELSVLGYEGNIVEQVRAALGIYTGGYPDLTALAERLHMSSRTLKRKLQMQGMQFQQLLDEARRRDSIRLLQDPTMKIDEIASRLGYSDPANFTRAFRKWMDCTPSAYRRRHEGQSAL